jgi:energy-coupling factor transporter ATP-binding protein EcfA2
MLAIHGNRQREIPLNNQAYEALAKWSKNRIDNHTSSLFITNKGIVKNLSARTVEHIIKKYSERAGIKKRVNAQILRNTFAVRLFSEETSKEKAAAILGISDYESISRYAQAAKRPPTVNIVPEDLAKLDTRPFYVRFISKLFPTIPRIAKPINEIKGPITPSPEETVFGREGVIEDIRSNLKKNQSVLLFGPIGIGKTHLLKHTAKLLGANTLYISTPAPLKSMLAQICSKLNPEYEKEIKTRASVREIIDYILRSYSDQSLILIIDNLNNIKSSEIEPFVMLLEKFTILGAVEDTIPRLKQVWWKFKQIEIKPLSEEASKELVKYLTQNLAISDYEMLETKVLTISNHLPLAIVDMIHQVSHRPVVNRDVIREVYHEAGIHYRDWTSGIVVLWGMAIISRFVALGTHSFEGYILAGFGTSVLVTVRYFVFKMR